MRRATFDETGDERAPPAPRPTHNCPAYGCPNAASVSLDGSRWACYYHAKAPSDSWPAVTQFVQQGWPATGNWGTAKAEYEAEQAALRRANLPPRRGPVLGPLGFGGEA